MRKLKKKFTKSPKVDPETIAILRAMIIEGRVNGCTCPICDQFIKEYRRSITGTMAITLIILYQRHLEIGKKEWIHVGEYTNTLVNIPHVVHTSPSKLENWGLVKSKLSTSKFGDAPCSGEYRVTKKGAMFVQNKIQVPKYVIECNNEILGFDDNTQVNILGALGTKFSYTELMQPAR